MGKRPGVKRDWLFFTGIWTMQVWVFCASFAYPGELSPLDCQMSSFFSNKQTTMILFLIVVAIITFFRAPKTYGGRLDWPLSMLTCFGTVFGTLGMFWFGSLAVVEMGALLSGIGVGWSYLRWGYLYSRLETKKVMMYAFAAGVMASVSKALLSLLPVVLSNCVCSLLPVLSVILLKGALRLLPEDLPEKIVYFGSGDLRGLWKLAICMFTVTCVCTLICECVDISGITLDASFKVLGRSIEIIVFSLMLHVVGVRGGSLGFPQFWAVVLAFGGAACFFLATDSHLEVAYMLGGVAINLIVYYFWIAMADIVRHSAAHPYLVFSMGWTVYLFPRVVRSFAGILFGTEVILATFPLVALLTLMFVSSYLLGSRDPYMQRVFSEIDDAGLVVDTRGHIEERCEMVAREYGLTSRETEIMAYLCRGRSKAYIAETLFVTENTVRSHVKRMYPKLGVHNRQELIDLVDNGRGGIGKGV